MPNTIAFPEYLVNQTPATIRAAFDSAKDEIVETGTLGNGINISDIITRCIQDVGRFAERYASDLIYTIDNLRELCNSVYPVEQPIDEILVCGIRRDGVDGNTFLMSRLDGTRIGPMDTSYVFAEHNYRRILAIRVQVSQDPGCQPHVTATLRNITDKFLHINKADIDPDNPDKLLFPPYPNGNPVPIDRYAKQSETSV